MNDSLMIAAVTAALSNRLSMHWPDHLSGAQVTTQAPHTARSGSENLNQLNLFLYQVVPNAARRARRGAIAALEPGGEPRQALNLYYLITAYGQNNDDLLSHKLLGHAMGRLQRQTQLQPDELSASLTEPAGFQWPGDALNITPHSLNEEELAKLWGIFQTPYHLSVAYMVSVVPLGGAAP